MSPSPYTSTGKSSQVKFYDDQPPPLQALTSARVSYRISPRAPGHRMWLTHSTPVSSHAIWAWYCPSCGRPRVPEAWVSPPSSPLSLPNALCLFPASGLTHLTSELAARSTVHAAGFPPVVGVPAAPVRPGLPSYSPDHSLLHPSTPWALALADDTFSPLHLHRHAGLTFLTWNVGGVDALVDYVCNMLIALDIDYFALQELWSFDSIPAAMPTHYASFRSTADGCGTGALVGWRRSLQHPSTRPRVEYDSHDLLVALMRHHTAGFVLVASVHVHPDLDYKARRAVLINLTSLAHYLRPNVELVGGDFNMSRTNSRHPLVAACRTGACMARYRPVFSADAPTHFTTTQHRHTATSIDHIFIRGARSITSADILPSPTPHRPLVATVEPLEGLTDVRSWRHVRWRLVPEGTIPRLAALMDLLWGWMAPTRQPPLTFLRALWAAARQHIPHPSPTAHILADLRRRDSPRTASDVTDLADLIAEAAARHGVDRPDVALRRTTLTSTTKGALARPSRRPHPAGAGGAALLALLRGSSGGAGPVGTGPGQRTGCPEKW